MQVNACEPLRQRLAVSDAMRWTSWCCSHCRDWEKYGLQASVEHQLWDLLKQHAKGLTVSEITSHLEGDFEDSKVWSTCYCMPHAIVS